MRSISIGMMLPTSGIRPMGKEYKRAFEKAINQTLDGSEYEPEIIVELINDGSIKPINDALDRFFGYHDVDIVTGIVSCEGMQHSLERFEKREVPFLCSNVGEHFFPSAGYNDHVFLNSPHLWQQSWLLGYFAASHLGKNGLIFSATYDIGYAFMQAFQVGVRDAENETNCEVSLIPMPPDGGLSPVQEAFDQVNLESKDFVFALFSGEEADLFINEFKSRNLDKKVALCALPFLLDSGKQDLSGLSVYTTVDQSNVKSDILYTDVFGNLGASAGTAIGETILANNGEIGASGLNDALRKLDNTKLYQSTFSAKLLGDISVLKNTFGKDNKHDFTILLQKTVDLDGDKDLNALRDAMTSNWVNPYLGV